MCGIGALWPLGAFVHLAFWVLLIAGIVWFVRRARPHQFRSPHPAQVLGERFARGEIDRDEYLERRTVLDPEGRQK